MNPPGAQLDFYGLLFNTVLTLDEACEMLDATSDRHVVHLVEEGRLCGFNIALDPAEGARREIRIHKATVEAMLYSRCRSVPARPAIFPVELALPHGRPNFLMPEVRRVLRCSERHAANLFPKALRQFGTGGSTRLPRLPREALIGFLRSREIV